MLSVKSSVRKASKSIYPGTSILASPAVIFDHRSTTWTGSKLSSDIIRAMLAVSYTQDIGTLSIRIEPDGDVNHDGWWRARDERSLGLSCIRPSLFLCMLWAAKLLRAAEPVIRLGIDRDELKRYLYKYDSRFALADMVRWERRRRP